MTKREVAILLIEAAVADAVDQQEQVIENLRTFKTVEEIHWALNDLENMEPELRDGLKENLASALWKRDPEGEFATILHDIKD